MKRNNTTDNSTNRLLALGIALTIGVWMLILFTGKQPEENPTTAKATSAQPEAKAKAKASGGFDAAAEFRERHNRALSPEAREDNRRKLWEQNFPWQPTYDSAVTATADMLSDYSEEDSTAVENHFDLKEFFEDEMRFSPQFEQLCRIMEEYDRTENPLALGWAFETLREYHRVMRKDPNEVRLRSNGEPVMRRVRGDPITLPDGSPGWTLTDKWETSTYGQHLENLRESICGRLADPYFWPHKDRMPKEQLDAVVERLINEIPGMADLKGSFLSDSGAIFLDTIQTLKVGDPLLVPYAGYQAAYEALENKRHQAINEGMARKRRKNRPAGILADGTLVNANNEPIKASAGSFGSFLNFGEKFDLQEMEDGSVRLSPEAMAVLDAEFRKQETN